MIFPRWCEVTSVLDRLRGMEVFAAVAALGTLSAAARKLDMSQTMATKHIAAVEARLGVKLFYRTTRRLSLTEAGQNYLEAVAQILDDVADADATAAAGAVDVRGTLRLNAPISFGVREIAPLLPDFTRAHPAVSVELSLSDHFVDLVEEGWDLAVRIGDIQNSSLTVRRLASCPSVVCAAPSYLSAHGVPATVADLAGHNCLSFTLLRAGGRWLFGDDRKTAVEVHGNLRSNNADALIVAAVRGQGITCQPEFLVAREIEAGELVRIELDKPAALTDGIFALYPAARPPAKVRAFIDFFAPRFRSARRGDRLAKAL
jgi:DNA-binding transcriptional LysR family regulator